MGWFGFWMLLTVVLVAEAFTDELHCSMGFQDACDEIAETYATKGNLG